MTKNDKKKAVEFNKSDLGDVMTEVRSVAGGDDYDVVITTEKDSFGAKTITVRTTITRANP